VKNKNGCGTVEIVGPSLISDRYTVLQMDKAAAYVAWLPEEYTVLSDSLKRLGDGHTHLLDMIIEP
jgi:hypothetical protein